MGWEKGNGIREMGKESRGSGRDESRKRGGEGWREAVIRRGCVKRVELISMTSKKQS